MIRPVCIPTPAPYEAVSFSEISPPAHHRFPSVSKVGTGMSGWDLTSTRNLTLKKNTHLGGVSFLSLLPF